MDPGPVSVAPPLPPRPVADTYWVVPGRLLVGAHPGAHSRAQAMDRLRRFLECGVTCFIDLTEPDETAAYEALLPFATPEGRRVEYMREPITDHGVPASRETMARILAMLDAALESGHLVYLHCRAGIGRSAMAAACWLAERVGDPERALLQLAEAWPQAAQSEFWPHVPETEQQRQFVLEWPVTALQRATAASRVAPGASLRSRLRGAWFGLALGDAWGDAHRRGDARSGALAWTQHTALTLCTAESLLATNAFDARDLIERFVRWQRAGHCTATGTPPRGAVSPDVAKALATFQWRGLPMAGSHDPHDVAATSLPRTLAAASFALADPPAAVSLAAECSRPTHQSPVILDACRLQAAMLLSALQAQPAPTWLAGLPVTMPPCLEPARLHRDVLSVATDASETAATARAGVLRALPQVRRIVGSAATFDAALQEACATGDNDAALYATLTGALFGAWRGFETLPTETLARLVGASQVEAIAGGVLQHARDQGVAA